MANWSYTVSSNSLWTSFDYGTVEADTYEEAYEKAYTKLKEDFDFVNDCLAKAGSDKTIEFYMHGIEVVRILK